MKNTGERDEGSEGPELVTVRFSAVFLTKIPVEPARYDKPPSPVVTCRRASQGLVKHQGEIGIVWRRIGFRDIPEDPADLFPERKRALFDQCLEFFIRHRQFVDVLVAGGTDHDNMAFAFFRERFFRSRDCRDAVQFEQGERCVLVTELTGCFDSTLDLFCL